MSEQRGRSFETEAISWMLVVVAVVGFAMFIWPNYYRKQRVMNRNACINNLRQIDAAANYFALVQSKTNGDAIHYPHDLTAYIKLNSAGKIPPCPGGGIYHLTKVGETPTCSLSTLTPAHVLP